MKKTHKYSLEKYSLEKHSLENTILKNTGTATILLAIRRICAPDRFLMKENSWPIGRSHWSGKNAFFGGKSFLAGPKKVGGVPESLKRAP